jgi:transaldolase/glucose-6-phosphate isomerase
MSGNPLQVIQSFGQSIWLDFLSRRMLDSGELARLIAEDGVRGVTSNPAIFNEAIGGSRDYDRAIRLLALAGRGAAEIYETLVVEDVRGAADRFRSLHDASQGHHGFVSLEVNPHLAHDTEGTVEEAQRLWAALDRPNVFIKVPATREGLPAIRRLIAEGINVNVTLLFGLPRYREVAEAYVAGLEDRAALGKPLSGVASVASFFLSRIDVLLDPKLRAIAASGQPEAPIAEALTGQVAIASAKLAYQIYRRVFATERFRHLAGRGAAPQRVLWASTSTKDPSYPDVKYVEALIGPDTVNTLPMETLEAYRDHGVPAARLTDGLPRAEGVLRQLAGIGIEIDRETQALEAEGVEKFNKPFDHLMKSLETRRAAALAEPVDGQRLELGEFSAAVPEQVGELVDARFAARLWERDASLWKADPRDQQEIRGALGWLRVAEEMVCRRREIEEFVRDVRAAGFTHAVHAGMGGSSMAPLVVRHFFPRGEGGLELTVLDTTDPATVLRVERSLPLEKTLFLVASKSGTTAETRAHGDHFYRRLRDLRNERAGENFVAITDPGSALAALAAERGFRHTFLNFPEIGGRYSALSYFGLVPAALHGVDVDELLARSLRMVRACGLGGPSPANPGLELGAALGTLARRGRDKLTFVMSPALATLGLWLEQLVAESTGKEGTGIVPVAEEPLGDPAVYGADRVFAYFRPEAEADTRLDRGVAALREAGHPVVTISLGDRFDLGQEFFRWEVATAVAGAVLRINPFDQPNVQESKDNTNRLLKTVAEHGELPPQNPDLVEGPLAFYGEAVSGRAGDALGRFLGQARPGDYLALMAYLTEEDAVDQPLRELRRWLRDRLRITTTLGYGPRFLHSTGQLHKGGPNTGLFLQLTADDHEDAEVPGKAYSFGVLKRAQAQGDLEALRRHGRRALRVHLGSDAAAGLAALRRLLGEAGGV